MTITTRLIVATLAALCLSASFAVAQPLALHPVNPHYFVYRGQPMILITSAEHYGAVMNLDFDYVKYLGTLQRAGMNHTRLFTGAAYIEPQGAFNIERNTMAPASGSYLAPWARSAVPGYANGGNKFDLSKWDESYWVRLKDFLTQAGKRGIIVEVNLFCPFYADKQWSLSPFNALNNINGVGNPKWQDVYKLDKHSGALPLMEKFTRRIVAELKSYENIYYEVMNEPYATGVPLDWQHHIADVIVESEKGFKAKHLISLNVNNGSAKVEKIHPAISIYNFHYAQPPDTVALNYGLNKVIGDNETGFRGVSDEPYRMEGWDFVMAGGGLFNHLDYSFAVGFEDGTFKFPDTSPGGGGATLRRSVKALRDFIYGFDFVRMKPDNSVIKGGVPDGVSARALVEAGRQYAIYFRPTSFAEFSARWTGFIEASGPKFSEEYTIFTKSNDGVRLWIDDQFVIDNWTDHSETEDSGKISLQAGKRYKLKLEYFYGGGWGVTRLFWQSASQKREAVPTAQLFAADGKTNGLTAQYFGNQKLERAAVLERIDPNVDFTWGNGLSPFAQNKGKVSELQLELPGGNYRVTWVDTKNGATVKQEALKHTGGVAKLSVPVYKEDVALSIKAK